MSDSNPPPNGPGGSSKDSGKHGLPNAFSRIDLDGHNLPPSPAPSSPSNGRKYAMATELVYTDNGDQYNSSSMPIYQVRRPIAHAQTCKILAQSCSIAMAQLPSCRNRVLLRRRGHKLILVVSRLRLSSPIPSLPFPPPSTTIHAQETRPALISNATSPKSCPRGGLSSCLRAWVLWMS